MSVQIFIQKLFVKSSASNFPELKLWHRHSLTELLFGRCASTQQEVVSSERGQLGCTGDWVT